ncbi:MAG: hypothetical protein ACO3TX_14255 [Pseudomonadales bacterium]
MTQPVNDEATRKLWVKITSPVGERDRLDIQGNSKWIRVLGDLTRRSMDCIWLSSFRFSSLNEILSIKKKYADVPLEVSDVPLQNHRKVPIQQDLKQVLTTQLIHSL